jgi:hypothetical protein
MRTTRMIQGPRGLAAALAGAPAFVQDDTGQWRVSQAPGQTIHALSPAEAPQEPASSPLRAGEAECTCPRGKRIGRLGVHPDCRKHGRPAGCTCGYGIGNEFYVNLDCPKHGCTCTPRITGGTYGRGPLRGELAPDTVLGHDLDCPKHGRAQT